MDYKQKYLKYKSKYLSISKNVKKTDNNIAATVKEINVATPEEALKTHVENFYKKKNEQINSHNKKIDDLINDVKNVGYSNGADVVVGKLINLKNDVNTYFKDYIEDDKINKHIKKIDDLIVDINNNTDHDDITADVDRLIELKMFKYDVKTSFKISDTFKDAIVLHYDKYYVGDKQILMFTEHIKVGNKDKDKDKVISYEIKKKDYYKNPVFYKPVGIVKNIKFTGDSEKNENLQDHFNKIIKALK